MIYEKSVAGQQEITGDGRVLGLKHRQVLIMVDGKRSRADLEAHLNNLNVAEILADLERLGYIYNPASARGIPPARPATEPAPSAAPVIQAQEPAISDEQLAEVKHILISSTNECLGIIGRGMTQKIEAVKSREELKAWISQWHMAIRESRLGKPLAGTLLEQVQQTLAS